MMTIIKKAFVSLRRIIVYCMLTLILLFPFIATVFQAFMTIEEAIQIPSRLFPSHITLESFAIALDGQSLKGIENTLKIVVFNIFAVTLSGYIVAYGFAKIRFAGSAICFAIGLSTMLVPAIVLTVPRYVLYVKFGWLNTLFPFIIPNLFGGGMNNIFLLTQFLRGIPNTYCDAAKIDGANELEIAFRIVMPLAKPILLLIVFNAFLGSWNDFTGPLTYIDTAHSEMWTLSVTIFRKFQYEAITEKERAASLKAAMALVMMTPSVIMFAFFQKTLINGVTFTGIKG